MRSLATGHYTEAQVDAALRAATGRFTRRFEVLDNSNNVIDELTTVMADPGDAVVEWNADRAVHGSLHLKMWPDEKLRGQLYRKRIRPWWGIEMPDRGIAEWTEGIYLWPLPEETLSRTEEWNVACGDLGQITNEDGPDLTGVTLFATERVTDFIKRLYGLAGFEDLSGIVDHPLRATVSYTWADSVPRTPAYVARERIESDLKSANVDPVTQAQVMSIVKLFAPDVDTAQATWLSIIEQITSAIGYYPPFFDLDGRPIVAPATDLPPEITSQAPGDLVAIYELLTTPTAELAYDIDTTSSIVVRNSASADHKLDGLANRLRLVASANPQYTGAVDLKAEDLMPGHPISKPVIGRYITQRLIDSTTADPIQLLFKALFELVRSMSMFQSVKWHSLAFPKHVGFETMTAAFDHPDFIEPQLCQESMWALDLNAGIMDHGARRLSISPTATT